MKSDAMYTRRTFLGQVALAAAGTVVLPAFNVRASDKSGIKLPVVGSGQFTFECVHEWLQPPYGMVWGDTHAVCQDAGGNIYLSHTVGKASMRGESVVVYDARGRFIRAFGEEFRGGAHGMDLHVEGGEQILYHCDTNRCKTVKTSLNGEILWEHGYPMEDASYAAQPINYVPTNVAFAPNGDYFVADGYGSDRVMKYSRDNRFLREIGKPAAGEGSPDNPDGELSMPHGLWVDDRGDTPVLAIADRANQRIQIFSLDGAHLRTVTDTPRLRKPCHFHTKGEWMVCPDLDSQVCILDRDYRVVAQIGDGKANNGAVGSRRNQSRDQFTPGQFICPHNAIFLQNGDILVCEWLPIGRITLLRHVAA